MKKENGDGAMETDGQRGCRSTGGEMNQMVELINIVSNLDGGLGMVRLVEMSCPLSAKCPLP